MIGSETLFSDLPPIDNQYQVSAPSGKDVMIVLDDDPTGTQTVHDVLVITEWTLALLEEGFKHPIFYILTNSRSLNEMQAYERVFEVCSAIKTVSLKVEKSFLIIARGDSTLRGHFKPEMNAIQHALQWKRTLTVFVPAFFPGGRYTVNDIQYVQENGKLIPAHQTPFAQDKTFGYQSENLFQYIKEKDNSVTTDDDIFNFSIEEIRTQSIEQLLNKIKINIQKKYLIINAADPSDLNKVAAVLKEQSKERTKILIRSAASMVPALAGITDKPFLNGQDLKIGNSPGIIIVGSYVPKSTEQLQYLLDHHPLESVELEVALLTGENAADYIEQKSSTLNQLMSGNRDVVVYTSRKLLEGDDAATSLSIVNCVSDGLISIIQNLSMSPSFIIAKGGITSSDIATKALRIKKAIVLGQLLPGVPVWQPTSDSKYSHIPYVIFPGNVGTRESLAEAYTKIKKA